MSSPTPPGARPFKFLAGDPGLDFVNTVDWTADGPRNDRLSDYAALLRWSVAAGTCSAAEAARLARHATAGADEAGKAHGRALRLREGMHRVWASVIAGKVPGAADLRRLERAAGDAGRHRVLAPQPREKPFTRLGWAWKADPGDLMAPLWPIALAAVGLLVSDEAARVRSCPAPDCGWLYVDRSRNGLRRWCAMDSCGAREKARRHYARVRRGENRG